MSNQGGDQGWSQSGGWNAGQGGGQPPSGGDQFGSGGQFGGGQGGGQYDAGGQYGGYQQQPQYTDPNYAMGGGGYGAPPPAGTNGMAIAALITGLLCGVVGVILGIISLGQIKRTGQGGKGLAIAGIVLGVLNMIGGLIVVLTMGGIAAMLDGASSTTATGQSSSTSESSTSSSSSSSSDTPSPDSSTVDAFSLSVGDCFQDPAVDSVQSVTALPCDQPHYAEAFHVFDVADAATFPGEQAMSDAASEGCRPAFQSFIGKDYDTSELQVFHFAPSAETWVTGDREVLCAVYDPAGMTTGTLAGANR